jgi:hypothetical protein
MNTTFERVSDGKDEWLTPPEIVQSLGPFDLDPCSPICRPWPTALKHYTIEEDGLLLPWFGRVWCNPPYGNNTAAWLQKCALHGNVMALIFARTETKMFFQSVWDCAHGLLFIKGRLKFYHVSGQQASSAGAPSVIVAYGKNNAESLENSNIKGKFIKLK